MSKSKKEVAEDVYEMEDILGYNVEDGKEQYFVKWKGYPVTEATWEPKNNIINPGPSLEKKMAYWKAEYEKLDMKPTSPKRKSLKQSTTPKASSTSQDTRKRRNSRREEEVETAPGPTATKSTPIVEHMRRGADGNSEYTIHLKYDDGSRQIIPLSEARENYGPQLLDYLLTRVRFRYTS